MQLGEGTGVLVRRGHDHHHTDDWGGDARWPGVARRGGGTHAGMARAVGTRVRGWHWQWDTGARSTGVLRGWWGRGWVKHLVTPSSVAGVLRAGVVGARVTVRLLPSASGSAPLGSPVLGCAVESRRASPACQGSTEHVEGHHKLFSITRGVCHRLHRGSTRGSVYGIPDARKTCKVPRPCAPGLGPPRPGARSPLHRRGAHAVN